MGPGASTTSKGKLPEALPTQTVRMTTEAQPTTQTAGMTNFTDSSDLCLSRFLSRQVIPFSPPICCFEKDYFFREVREALFTFSEKEYPILIENTSLECLRDSLGKFFAPRIVESVILNFLEVRDSCLGQKYFLFGGIAMLGIRILADIIEELYILWTAKKEDWTSENQHELPGGSSVGGVSSGRGFSTRDSYSRGGRRGSGRRGGRGGRGGGGGGRDGVEGNEDIAFSQVQAVDIIPFFSTPDKNVVPMNVVTHTIGERSLLFDVQVQNLLVDIPIANPQFYDPMVVEDGFIFLFHGMRQTSWPRFRRYGIQLASVPNEFSSERAFYVTNSIRQAFEHPLHHHPRRSTHDFISILVFAIPVPVMHGLASPAEGDVPFNIKWFEEADDEWRHFCRNNLVDSQHCQANHSYDIVIGPSCLHMGGRDVGVLEIDGLQPTQVACCSKRAWDWMASTACTIFVEKREI